MYKISELAAMFGLSRSTLLYYDRIAILQPSDRSPAGYRIYTEEDRHRLERICAYRKAGLSLDKIRSALEEDLGPDDRTIRQRFHEAGKEINALRKQQQLLTGMIKQKHADSISLTVWLDTLKSVGLDGEAIRELHGKFEKISPDFHHDFLLSIGLSEKEAVHVRRWLPGVEIFEGNSKYYYEVLYDLPRISPGGDEFARKALSMLKDLPDNPSVLDIGCGTGAQSLWLASRLAGSVTAVDNHGPFLEILQQKAKGRQLKSTIKTVEASMFDFHFPAESFDLIWSEATIFLMGFEKGIREWSFLLKKGGYLVVSELTWLTDAPSPEIKEYWDECYPQMQNVQENLRVAQEHGYTPIAHFMTPESSWWKNFYTPFEARIAELEKKYEGDASLNYCFSSMRIEVDMFRRFSRDYGNVFYIFRK